MVVKMNSLDRLTLAAIRLYQRHISPRKGFCCAHRAAWGGPSCSAFTHDRITEVGLWGALPEVRERFSACKKAAEALRKRREAREKRRKEGNSSACEFAALPCECLPHSLEGCGGGLGGAGAAAAGGCDGCACTPF